MHRIREVGLLQALIEGREEEVGRALRSEAAPAEDERVRERPKQAESPPPRPAPPSPARGVRELLASRRSLRQAMILHEVLGPPTSLRSE
jgi:hypothetical protein